KPGSTTRSTLLGTCKCLAVHSVVSNAATVIGITATSASNPARGPNSATTRRNAGSARLPGTKRMRGGRVVLVTEASRFSTLSVPLFPAETPEGCRCQNHGRRQIGCGIQQQRGDHLACGLSGHLPGVPGTRGIAQEPFKAHRTEVARFMKV